VRVDVGLAAEIVDEVDDDLDATGLDDLELLGADSEVNSSLLGVNARNQN
jgi:hypothetical protein